MNKSQQIRDYAAANPTATGKEISTALGMKNAYVHSVLWASKRKPAPKKTRPTLKKYLTNKPIVNPQIEAELAYAVGKGRNRVHPVTGKILMQGADPMPVTMHEPKSDPVNHPAHYKVGGIETIDFIEAKRLNYNMGNAVKYITRADHKGSRKQDLEKAIWYLKRELDHSV
jgi:hypothetical protein